MCGRYVRRGQKQEIAERMKAGIKDPQIPDLIEHYNIAPTTFQPVVRNTRGGGVRELLLMRWGLIPHFAKSLADWKGMSTINAKCEDIALKPTWKGPLSRGQRCLVPADAFYEWKVLDPTVKKPQKQPYAFTINGGKAFAFAALWDAWHDKAQDTWLQSFTIITTGPNDVTREVHTRMPVILHESNYDEWLLREGPAPVRLLKPFPAAEMEKKPVSKDVGNIRNNHPELLNSK